MHSTVPRFWIEILFLKIKLTLSKLKSKSVYDVGPHVFINKLKTDLLKKLLTVV